MSRICGIDITGKSVCLLILEGSKEQFEVVESKPLKIELSDHMDQSSVKEFYRNIVEFFSSNEVTHVTIKSGSTGMYKSGPAVFKIEALIQMADVEIEFVKPQTLTAFWKKTDIDIDSYKLKKYQHNAFKLAYYSLEGKQNHI